MLEEVFEQWGRERRNKKENQVQSIKHQVQLISQMDITKIESIFS